MAMMTLEDFMVSKGFSRNHTDWYGPGMNNVPAAIRPYTTNPEDAEGKMFDAQGIAHWNVGRNPQPVGAAPGAGVPGGQTDADGNIWAPQSYIQAASNAQNAKAQTWETDTLGYLGMAAAAGVGGLAAAGLGAGAGAGAAGELAGLTAADLGVGSLGGIPGGGGFLEVGALADGLGIPGITEAAGAAGAGAGAGSMAGVFPGAGYTLGSSAAGTAAGFEAALAGLGVGAASGGVLQQLQDYISNPQNLAQSAASNAATSALDLEDAAQGTAMQNALNQGGGPGINSPLTTGGAVGAGSSALRWLSEATGIPEGALSTLGTLGQGGLGILSGMQQSNATTGIANQLRADRAPALGAFNNALTNPNSWYQSAPAMGATDAVLRKLSMGGNPANNPGALSQAAAYNLGGYNDYLRALSGPAFGTASAETNVNMAGVQQQGGAWEAGGSLLQNLLNPKQNYGLNLGSFLT